ncbi:heme biosynthesis HemY N-terminal domain-containing protein [Methylocucumis oryzae]|uniref:heme biosynthesis HemY N-terminal domain-containing protein n=1 Tax=Methylocucumis oryzae TaxID=1632867 RepID=UPI001EF9EE69|nr:heme biosynthesis HemY N-terminal domain-containing protein [Methylocucumis oryzae]
MKTPGYVLIGLGHWSIETTLAVFAIGLIITFFILYYCFRGLGWLIRLPARLKKTRQNLAL